MRAVLAGLACRFFVASTDPNPTVNGKGIGLIKVAVIVAITGVL